jgi:deoxyribose-phosphate aldolase
MHLEKNFPVNVNDSIASHLEYACLEAGARSTELRMVCAEAEKYQIGSVLVNPVNVSEAVKYLDGTGIRLAAVIAYPMGAYPPQIKQFEMQDAIENGATGITMLAAIGRLKDGLYDDIRAELDILAGLPANCTGRLMIEASALTIEQQSHICELAADAGIKAVVTSTGFDRGGFSEIDAGGVRQLVQSAGGIVDMHVLKYRCTLQEVYAYLQAGACRVITTSVREVIQACQTQVRDVVQ